VDSYLAKYLEWTWTKSFITLKDVFKNILLSEKQTDHDQKALICWVILVCIGNKGIFKCQNTENERHIESSPQTKEM
jgi:hypothetical protein